MARFRRQNNSSGGRSGRAARRAAPKRFSTSPKSRSDDAGQQIAFGVQAAQEPHENHAPASVAGHAERGCDKGFNYLFQGRIPVGFLLKSVEQSQPFLICGYGPAQNHGFEQRFFGVEMVMNGRQIHSRATDDAAQGSGRVALFREQALRRIENALLGVVHRRLNQTYEL